MCFSAAILAAATLITNATDLASAMNRAVEGARFELTGTVATAADPEGRAFEIVDADGIGLRVLLADGCPRGACGDVVRLSGVTRPKPRCPVTFAHCLRLERLGRAAPPKATPVDVRDLGSERLRNRLISIRGTVRECFRDEIDPEWVYLVLGGSNTVFAATSAEGHAAGSSRLLADMQTLIGAEISVRAVHVPSQDIARKLAHQMTFAFVGKRSIRILRAAPGDPFAVPALEPAHALSATAVQTLGRRRLVGHVLTVWRGNRLLVRGEDGDLHGVALANGPLPDCGARIETAGRAETDLYHVNLANAVWRPLADPPRTEDPPTDVSARELLSDESGYDRINSTFHGRRIRLAGTVQDRLKDASGRLSLLVRNGDHVVTADLSSAPDAFAALDIGCRVAVTGVCVIETGVWLPDTEFPHATGIVLVVNRAGDIAVLSRPPWWTPLRLTAVIGSLLVALVAIFIWNASLRRLAERRGRQLFREQVARAGSEMRIEERTRLAVELHDSISQNLTGASMQIDAAGRNLDRDRDRTLRHLDIASRTLDSCREELRNCIWDLRNQALDEKDMNVAIRRTVQPHVSGAELTVRFNVPRALLSDNTTHALLRIIRELATNAVRHGGAKSIRIAGALEDGSILFSVTDDGRGFDPDDHPGIAEGHFGLQGVAERVRRLGGRMTVESAPGRGARIALSLRTHKTGNG